MKSLKYHLKRLVVLYFAILSRFLNTAFRTLFNRVIYLTGMVVVLFAITSPLSSRNISFWLFALGTGAFLSVTVTRISNNFIYSYLTKHASMIVNDLSWYRSQDYIRDVHEVAQKLQTEFKEALIYASSLNCAHYIRFSTHEWFVKNVVLQPEIISLYEIQIIQKKTTIIAMEILILIPWQKILSFDPILINMVLQKRNAYKVKLHKTTR